MVVYSAAAVRTWEVTPQCLRYALCCLCGYGSRCWAYLVGLPAAYVEGIHIHTAHTACICPLLLLGTKQCAVASSAQGCCRVSGCGGILTYITADLYAPACVAAAKSTSSSVVFGLCVLSHREAVRLQAVVYYLLVCVWHSNNLCVCCQVVWLLLACSSTTKKLSPPQCTASPHPLFLCIPQQASLVSRLQGVGCFVGAAF